MTRSDAINELAAALAKAQAKIKAAPKDNVAEVSSQRTGKSYKYSYSTLADVWEACRAPLADNGIAVIQPVVTDGPKVTITTLLAHSSGQWIGESLTMIAEATSPQAVGSCITYGRRYGLGAMVGVVSEEDDDGQAASRKAPVKQTHSEGPANGNGQEKPEQIEARLAGDCAKGWATWQAKKDWREAHRSEKDRLPMEAQLRLSKAWSAAKPVGSIKETSLPAKQGSAPTEEELAEARAREAEEARAQ